MNESNYLSGEFSDDFLHAQADAGDYLLDEEAFQYRPTQDEMKKLALEAGRAIATLYRLLERQITMGPFGSHAIIVQSTSIETLFSKVIFINR